MSDHRHRCGERCRLPDRTCVHDAIAEHGAHTLDEVAAHFGLSRERIRQIEVEALGKLRAALEAYNLDFEGLLPGELVSPGERIEAAPIDGEGVGPV